MPDKVTSATATVPGRDPSPDADLGKGPAEERTELGNLQAHVLPGQLLNLRARFGREDGVVSDTARLPWFWSGLGVVSGLGPGLTC
jgi:hypothetical protein